MGQRAACSSTTLGRGARRESPRVWRGCKRSRSSARYRWRGCGLAGLAIATLMVGLSWDMVLAAKVGGLLVLFVCMVLLGKAHRARRRRVERTELWLMLDRSERPGALHAQRIIGSVLRLCYLRFALHAAGLSALLLALSLSLQLHRGPADEVASIVQRQW
jgi:predicted lysophospholipase L1 biosynthesis ABC-type transport system permease subunit